MQVIIEFIELGLKEVRDRWHGKVDEPGPGGVLLLGEYVEIALVLVNG